jgi:hypothetical protein
MANAVNPESPDYCVWNKTGKFMNHDQPIVDAAYFASAIIKAKRELWDLQPQPVQKNILTAFEKVLLMRPLRSNWLLFTVTVEACKYMLTGVGDTMRADYAFTKFYEWYAGDGAFGDGPEFAFDYYNSFVIQPMLEETSRIFAPYCDGKYKKLFSSAMKRYAEIQERMIAPDGSYPATGRSITYRASAFQSLAHSAYRGELPKNLPAGQVRHALDLVIKKMMSAPTLFDENGFLTKGLYGKQESLTNYYTNTGSLYICLCVFLPLGLSAKNKFWTEPDKPTTWEKIWSGQDMPFDYCVHLK